jgi:hypothetical protein
MNEVFDDFKSALSDAGLTEEELQKPNTDILGKLGEILETKFKLENAIALIEENLESHKALLKDCDQLTIPRLLEAAGLSSVKTATGHTIKVEDVYRGNISEANSPLVLDWFIQSGGADTIKNNYVVPISIADKETADILEQILVKTGMDFSRKLGIAWNTLAGVIKELDTTGKLQYNETFEKLKKEKSLPEDLTLEKILGVYKYKTTKVQQPKNTSK